MLSALNRPDEFALHVRAAIGNGVTRDELKDALIQVGIYCGVPAGVEAFRIATRVLRELEAVGVEAAFASNTAAVQASDLWSLVTSSS